MDSSSTGWTIAALLSGGLLTAWGTCSGTTFGWIFLISAPLPTLAMGLVSLPRLDDMTWRAVLSAAVGVFAGVCVVPGTVALLHNRAKAQPAMSSQTSSGTQMSADNPAPAPQVGDDSVVYGRVSPNLRVGSRSVVVGATDANGNTILNQPMAVGAGAYAGPGSIAIGAGAGAGMRPPTDQK
jgi:hypothetical protein